MVLRIGTGGDEQSHVSSPKSIRKEPTLASDRAQEVKAVSNGNSAAHSLAKSPKRNTHNAQSEGHRKPEPRKPSVNPSKTLKRIQSELETIHERKEEKNDFEREESCHEHERVMADESYSYSLRQFERQNSKIDLGASAGTNELQRLANNSPNIETSGPSFAYSSFGKRHSGRVNLGSPYEFGPFSKRRNLPELNSAKNRGSNHPANREQLKVILDENEDYPSTEVQVKAKTVKFYPRSVPEFEREAEQSMSEQRLIAQAPDESSPHLPVPEKR